MGKLVAGPLRILSRLAMGVGLGSKIPTMPPFFYWGSESSLVGKSMFDRHIMGNSLPLMLLNFRCKFHNFLCNCISCYWVIWIDPEIWE